MKFFSSTSSLSSSYTAPLLRSFLFLLSTVLGIFLACLSIISILLVRDHFSVDLLVAIYLSYFVCNRFRSCLRLVSQQSTHLKRRRRAEEDRRRKVFLVLYHQRALLQSSFDSDYRLNSGRLQRREVVLLQKLFMKEGFLVKRVEGTLIHSTEVHTLFQRDITTN
jgi:hypothetical protein